MLSEEEWLELARKVTDLTTAGRLKWVTFGELVPDMAPTLMAQVSPKTQYRVFSSDGDGRFPYRVSILRRERDEKYELVDTFLTREFELGDGSASDWIYDLFMAAGRSASGAAQVMSSLLQELEELEDPNTSV